MFLYGGEGGRWRKRGRGAMKNKHVIDGAPRAAAADTPVKCGMIINRTREFRTFFPYTLARKQTHTLTRTHTQNARRHRRAQTTNNTAHL